MTDLFILRFDSGTSFPLDNLIHSFLHFWCRSDRPENKPVFHSPSERIYTRLVSLERRKS